VPSEQIADLALKAGVSVYGIEEERANLEQLYFSLTQGQNTPGTVAQPYPQQPPPPPPPYQGQQPSPWQQQYPPQDDRNPAPQAPQDQAPQDRGGLGGRS
jgi:ABC-2 type transport system ATP-binding protein